MAFSLEEGKLGFKIGDILVALEAGTTTTPETLESTHHNLHVALRVWNPDTLTFEYLTGGSGGLNIASPNSSLTLRLDETTTAGTTYIGQALPGTVESAPAWRIRRLVDSPFAVLYADGDADFDNVWDNRASLTYV